ncbi:acyltransferase family protein [Polynucleobacter sp. AP-Sanab-80-C2]|uniref:acyltransferase family protein n=1 Tax=Polynucleobacter sp. AP-Sanab-80-C2 TaxID=3108274 RepID=UPI002B22A375|nr:acyltransferase family protein [Polynucleobacter sp. AP-Sanab-80-C2]MEA9598896.1 acyltransferase family protein [Polynucleobacter sp. AP-Sanab-80-C2]
MSLKRTKYRPDIDGLRSFGIVPLLGFHAFPGIFSGGFIAVDIFFVISGFLITTIILQNLEKNSFSFIEFYSRRIRRIFPALFLVLLACYAFGWFALYASEYMQLGKHIAAGAGFMQNFVLWDESGYFDNSSKTKPLLHLWSLAIEEQFYIFWPLILWVAFKKKLNVLKITLIIACISFLINLWMVTSNPIADYYSPFSRFWELLIGAIWAYIALNKNIDNKISARYSNVLSILGMVSILIAMFIVDDKSPFPGWWALLPTLGTVMLLAAGQDAWVNKRILSNKVLVWFGLISYPLYLWHWPLLSFGQIIAAGKLPTFYKLMLIVVSIVLAQITYKYFESPTRNKSHKTTLVLLVLVGLIGSQGWSAYVRDGLGFREKHVLDLHGGRPPQIDEGCLEIFDNYQPTFCRLSKTKNKLETILIGDSIAHSAFPGIAKKYSSNGKNFAMVGWPARQPFLKLSSDKDYEAEQSEQMNKLINGIARNSDVRTIVLAMNQPEITDSIRVQLRRTVEYFKNNNKQVIFIYPPPRLTFDPIECVGMPPFRPILNEDCTQQVKDIDKRYFADRLELKKLVNEVKILSYDTYPRVCDEQQCKIRLSNGLLYRLELYFTEVGSEIVFQGFSY